MGTYQQYLKLHKVIATGNTASRTYTHHHHSLSMRLCVACRACSYTISLLLPRHTLDSGQEAVRIVNSGTIHQQPVTMISLQEQATYLSTHKPVIVSPEPPWQLPLHHWRGSPRRHFIFHTPFEGLKILAGVKVEWISLSIVIGTWADAINGRLGATKRLLFQIGLSQDLQLRGRPRRGNCVYSAYILATTILFM